MLTFLLTELLRLNNYQIEKKEFNKELVSQSDYPSLSAIKNTMDKFGIESIIAEFKSEHFNDLPDVFISSLKQDFSELFLVIKKDKKVSIIKSKEHKNDVEIDVFLEYWSGLVIAIEKQIDIDKKPQNIFNVIVNAIFITVISLILIFGFLNFNKEELFYIIISLIGTYYCIEIYKSQHGIKSQIIDKICSINKKENSCQIVMQGDKINVLGLKLSDLALFYFLTTTIFSLFINDTYFILITLSILGFPVLIYSLYMQIFQIKKICKVCLILIGIVLSNSIISLLYFEYNFSISVLILSLIYLFSITPTYIYINRIINDNRKLEYENIINIRFKRDYNRFKREIFSSKKIKFEYNSLFFVGKKDAKVHFTLISNLECIFCEKAFYVIKDIYMQNKENVSFQIRFNFFNREVSPEIERVLRILMYAYSKGENYFLSILDVWYQNKKEFIFKREVFEEKNIQEIIYMEDENIKEELNVSPILLVNGYVFSEKYEIEDINYFIKNLIEE